MPSSGVSELIFLGTGPSCCVPWLRCITAGTRPIESHRRSSVHAVPQTDDPSPGTGSELKPCYVCREATLNPFSKNRRRTPSILLRFWNEKTQEKSNILIDCGKSFRDAVETFFPQIGIPQIDAVILSHGHADAVLGIDDVRDLQHVSELYDPDAYRCISRPVPIPIWCCSATLKRCYGLFPYLFSSIPRVITDSNELDKAEANNSTYATFESVRNSLDEMLCEDFSTEKQSSPIIKKGVGSTLYVAAIDWKIFESFKPFCVCGSWIVPLPVLHGENYISYGFEFGTNVRVVYISDVSLLLEYTFNYLSSGPRIDLLIIDALFWDKPHSTHLNKDQAIEIAIKLRCRRCVLTGMSHHFDYFLHNQIIQNTVKELGGDLDIKIEMGFDGMCINFPMENY